VTLTGVVTEFDPSTHQFVLHEPGTIDTVVDLRRDTKIVRAGKSVPLANLLTGQRVSVAGVLNGRVHEIVQAERIEIQP